MEQFYQKERDRWTNLNSDQKLLALFSKATEEIVSKQIAL